jgi:hypothetical protein
LSPYRGDKLADALLALLDESPRNWLRLVLLSALKAAFSESIPLAVSRFQLVPGSFILFCITYLLALSIVPLPRKQPVSLHSPCLTMPRWLAT